MDLSGKTVVYIGGFGGIGYATCKILAGKGVKHLIILDLCENSAYLTTLQEINGNTHFMPFDISGDLNAIRQTIDEILTKFHTIDVVVNGAGIAIVSPTMIPKIIKVNLEGPINVMVALMEKFDKRHGGRGALSIVNVASIAGLQPVPAFPTYSATKAGLLAFGAACAKLYEKSGIAVIAICPAATDTAMLGSVESFIDDDKEFIETVKRMALQTPDECGANIVRAIELNQNGSVWLLERGAMESVGSEQCMEKQFST